MLYKRVFSLIIILLFFYAAGCTKPESRVVELNHFPMDNMEGVITQSGVQVDKDVSSDGNGSLRIESTQPAVVQLFEVKDLNIESARLTYQARLRTSSVEGQVYLEMLCGFSGMGEFFSRSIERPLTGTTEWTTVETPFFLQEGQKPDYVKLNLVIDGKGTVWIDDIKLLKRPLD